jgi:hypothetical protein
MLLAFDSVTPCKHSAPMALESQSALTTASVPWNLPLLTKPATELKRRASISCSSVSHTFLANALLHRRPTTIAEARTATALYVLAARLFSDDDEARWARLARNSYPALETIILLATLDSFNESCEAAPEVRSTKSAVLLQAHTVQHVFEVLIYESIMATLVRASNIPYAVLDFRLQVRAQALSAGSMAAYVVRPAFVPNP